MSYRYSPYGRRPRPPRGKAHCKACNMLIDLDHLDKQGLCFCCQHTEPLFFHPRTGQVRKVSQW